LQASDKGKTNFPVEIFHGLPGEDGDQFLDQFLLLAEMSKWDEV